MKADGRRCLACRSLLNQRPQMPWKTSGKKSNRINPIVALVCHFFFSRCSQNGRPQWRHSSSSSLALNGSVPRSPFCIHFALTFGIPLARSLPLFIHPPLPIKKDFIPKCLFYIQRVPPAGIRPPTPTHLSLTIDQPLLLYIHI